MARQNERSVDTCQEEIFDLECGKFHMLRISDAEYYDKWLHGLPVREDYILLMDLSYYNEWSLGEMLVSLESFFGKRGGPFDDWKGTFGFEFLLTVNDKFPYLFKVGDLKGSFFYTLYKISEKQTPRLSTYINPIENEFSESQIRYFISYFYGFIHGYFKAIVKNTSIEPFVNDIQCCNILYGYWGDRFHQKQYESEEELDQHKEEISAIIQNEVLSKSASTGNSV